MRPAWILCLAVAALGACSSAGSEHAPGDDPGGGASGTGGTPDGADVPVSNGSGSGTGAGADGGSGPGSDRAACPTTATAVPGETTRTITVGGRSRSFLVHVPPGYTGRAPVPLVMDFHPLGGSATQQRGLSGWGAVADAKNFIVVWPNGVGNSWNVGRCCGSAQSGGVDDVAFARAIVARLAADACIDAKRVYATGCSNGGGMAYKLACDAADAIAAVAPVDFDCITGATNSPSCGRCAPARPISEIQFRGTSDSAVPYNGGPTPVVQGLSFPGAQANLATWGTLNQCTGTPAALPTRAACKAYPACGGSADTVLCTVQNGSHCGSYASFGIAAFAWSMFENEQLP